MKIFDHVRRNPLVRWTFRGPMWQVKLWFAIWVLGCAVLLPLLWVFR